MPQCSIAHLLPHHIDIDRLLSSNDDSFRVFHRADFRSGGIEVGSHDDGKTFEIALGLCLSHSFEEKAQCFFGRRARWAVGGAKEGQGVTDADRLIAVKGGER